MRNVGNLNDEGSICFLTDPDSFTTQEGVCPSHTVGALRRGDGTSWGAHAPPAVCHIVVTAESGGGPAPGLCGSLTRLFPRYVQEVIQRGRSCVRPACTPVLSVVPAVSDTELSETETKSQRKAGGGNSQLCDSIVVAYYFCGEPIPYRTLVRGRTVTLGQFKELLTKKGNYRYYFKKVSDEFDCGVVFEEVREDEAILPVFEEKIIGKVEKVD